MDWHASCSLAETVSSAHLVCSSRLELEVKLAKRFGRIPNQVNDGRSWRGHCLP